MRCKISSITIAISLLICCGLSFNCNPTPYNEEPVKNNNSSETKINNVSNQESQKATKDLVSIGIKNPAGERAILTFSEQSAKTVNSILAYYPHEMFPVSNNGTSKGF